MSGDRSSGSTGPCSWWTPRPLIQRHPRRAPSLIAILARHRVQQQADRLALGESGPASTWCSPPPPAPRWHLATSPECGTACDAKPATYNLRLHDLRHSCASILTALGIHPRVVRETLRHSHLSITMDTYAHVAPLLQRQAADALEAALFS